MRIQGVNITYAKLKELLGLPNEAIITAVEKREHYPRSFAVFIEHPSFDEYDEEWDVGTWYSLDDFLDRMKKE